jgi:hypothetical protein
VGRPLWLWPNLLSLDAPLVALVWQLLFARCFHSEWRAVSAVLLAITVWLIYAGDRMLDALRGEADEAQSPRHDFYRRHWRAVLPVWIGLLATATWLARARLDPRSLRRGLLLVVAVAVYLAMVHIAPRRWRRFWPKEAAVAILFALGASLDTWSSIRSSEDVLTIAFFSALCWINCRAIEAWEHAAIWPTAGLAACIAVAAAVTLAAHRPVLASAEFASALAFICLDRSRLRLSSDALRVLADVALLSPLPLLPLAGKLI